MSERKRMEAILVEVADVDRAYAELVADLSDSDEWLRCAKAMKMIAWAVGRIRKLALEGMEKPT